MEYLLEPLGRRTLRSRASAARRRRLVARIGRMGIDVPDVVADGTVVDVDRWLRRQAMSGTISAGERLALLSEASGLRVVDLDEEPADAARGIPDATACLAGRWLPWEEVDDGVVVVRAGVPSVQETIDMDRALNGRLAGIVLADPDRIRAEIESRCRGELIEAASEGFDRSQPTRSSKRGLTGWQVATPLLVVIAAAAAVAARPEAALFLVWLCAFAGIAANVGFKVVAAAFGIRHRRRASSRPAVLDDDDLPSYTILVPMLDEANLVETVVRSVRGLDYPADLLQVLFVIEEHDRATRAKFAEMSLPPSFEVVVVPGGSPQTKPRACNYALPYATGEHVVIFDAEDEPEVGQLRAAAAAFAADAQGDLACLQARLHYYNARANLLTRLFALEYAYWFDVMLPGLQALRLPIPLGGTSNHFRTSALREIGGWDPYNVTEDADLGMRIGAAGYRTDVLDSTTWEEACGKARPWLRQRTRWIKGYIITAGVYTRDLPTLVGDAGFRGLVSIVGLILSTPIAFLMYPLLIVLPILQFAGLAPYPDIPAPLLIASYVVSVVTAVVVIALSAVAGFGRYGGAIAWVALLSPAYWMLHSAASWRALRQAVTDPHRWEKTPHGLQTAVHDVRPHHPSSRGALTG